MERYRQTSECANQTQDDQREPSTYQPGSRYRASDVPSQYSADHYDYHYDKIQDTAIYQNVDISPSQRHLELPDTDSYQNVEISPDQHHQETNDNDDDAYDQQPVSPYDHPDRAITELEMPPTPSVYDILTRWKLRNDFLPITIVVAR